MYIYIYVIVFYLKNSLFLFFFLSKSIVLVRGMSIFLSTVLLPLGGIWIDFFLFIKELIFPYFIPNPFCESCQEKDLLHPPAIRVDAQFC